MGALSYEGLIMSKMYDPEERQAEGLAKEGGGRRDGRPALRRINYLAKLCLSLDLGGL